MADNNKCEYCGLPLKTDDPNKTTHKLCDVLKQISGGRNLTYANEDDYPMMYVKSIKSKFPNLRTNSDHYVYVHEVVARLILGRDLISQGNDDSEIVDHKDEDKKNFSPKNLRVMRLDSHISSHKKEKGKYREYED